MNYRHAFHAGNFADVVKHATLLVLLELLAQKDKPFCYLDSHAGIGRYDLDSDEARRTQEHAGGIQRLLGAQELPPALARYRDLVLSMNPERAGNEPLRHYPGSPWIARALLREQDRAVLMELHPEDAGTLKEVFRDDRRVAVHHTDGYNGLKAFLPPPERRGLVLIDPPYEAPDEFDRLLAALSEAHRRWSTGVYAVWYPLKDPRAVGRFQDGLAESGIRKILRAELTLFREPPPGSLFYGSGMAIINPPWQTESQLAPVLEALRELLAPEGAVRLDWLVPE